MSVPDPHLREELLDEYRHANETFHQMRKEWEHWLEAPAYRHDERVEAAREKLREAEQKLEDVEERIRQAYP